MTTWDPEVLARIRHLGLVARQAVTGIRPGLHPSRWLGSGVEFVDYKDYAPGDSLRHLDWRVLARRDRLVVRRFRAESDLPCLVLLDASADMGTGEAAEDHVRPPLEGSQLQSTQIQGTKMGYALCLCATLIYYLHLHGEPAGLAVMGGRLPGLADSAGGAGSASGADPSGGLGPVLPPRSGRGQLARALAVLAHLVPHGEARIGRSVAEVTPRLRRHALFVVVSDLMEEVDSWAPALRGLLRRRADLRVVHLWDPAEMALDYRRPRLFLSPEGGEPLPLDPEGARSLFQEELDRYRDEVRRAVRTPGGIYLSASTGRPLAEPLSRLLAAGRTSPGLASPGRRRGWA